VNPEKTKYMLMSRSQKVGQECSIKIANKSFEYVAKFKYLRTTLTDQNHMHEYQGVGGRMGSKWTLGRLVGGEGDVEWIHLAHDRDHWRALVNAVMNLRVLAPWN
jgi:hypothetical protein